MSFFREGKAAIVIVVSVIGGLLLPVSAVQAETIVNKVPIYQREPGRFQPRVVKPVVRENKESAENAAARTAVKELSAAETAQPQPAVKQTDIAANNNNKQEPVKPTGKADTGYDFSRFHTYGPDFSSSFGEGSDLAGLSSLLYCASQFSMKSPDEKENVFFYVQKSKIADAFDSDTSIFFSVNTALNIPLIISKKRQPYFELDINGKKSIVNFSQISYYSKTGLTINAENMHLLDGVYVPGAAVSLMLYKEDGGTLRLPIPDNVIKQWQQVTSADLKQMKKDYETK